MLFAVTLCLLPQYHHLLQTTKGSNINALLFLNLDAHLDVNFEPPPMGVSEDSQEVVEWVHKHMKLMKEVLEYPEYSAGPYCPSSKKNRVT